MEVRPLGHEIANIAEKCLIGIRVVRCAAMRGVPLVDCSLKRFTLRQKGAVFWCQILNDLGKARPESIRIDSGFRQHLIVNQGEQIVIDA